MTENEKPTDEKREVALGRRGFFYTVFGGALAALAGWIAGAFPDDDEGEIAQQGADLDDAQERISALEAQVEQLKAALVGGDGNVPLGQLEGEFGERVIFNKSEVSVINPEGVLLNLVATHGHVGIRFYKDFDFGNEKETSPWHMGYIEGVEGYEGLAILRDWRFTATLWEADGRMLVGRLDPHPPANAPAEARFHVRGTLDEVQALVEASGAQTADVFQVAGGGGRSYLSVDGAGDVHVGSPDGPKRLILHDSVDGSAYALQVTGGELTLARV